MAKPCIKISSKITETSQLRVSPISARTHATIVTLQSISLKAYKFLAFVNRKIKVFGNAVFQVLKCQKYRMQSDHSGSMQIHAQNSCRSNNLQLEHRTVNLNFQNVDKILIIYPQFDEVILLVKM